MSDYREVKFDPITYTNAYAKEHYDKITIVAPKGTKASFQTTAKAQGLSVTQYVLNAVKFYEQYSKKAGE